MAKTNITPPSRGVKKNISKNVQEVKLIFELNIPQLGSSQTLSDKSMSAIERFAVSGLGDKPAKLSITPVQEIHIVEIEVNAVELVRDTDVQKDEVFVATKDIFPTRPLSLFINITGIPNTMVEVILELDSTNEFKGNLFIPNSGRLIIQKIIP